MILRRSVPSWLLSLAAIGCCGRGTTDSQSKGIPSEPLDIAILVHSALREGSSRQLRPVVVTESAIRSIAVDAAERQRPVRSPDGIAEHFFQQIDKAIQDACLKYQFKNSRITAFRVGNRVIEKTYGDMIRIEPSECVDHMVMEVTLASSGASVKVRIGGIIRIGGEWKLDGWFAVSDAD